jgi:hypothetical protein
VYASADGMVPLSVLFSRLNEYRLDIDEKITGIVPRRLLPPRYK